MQSLHRRFSELVYDPQISIPDVIVWVLTNGVRRAFIRIPAVDLMYHAVPEYQGRLFGVVQTKFMQLPKAYKGKESIAADIPAQIQLRVSAALTGTVHYLPISLFLPPSLCAPFSTSDG
jgi:hypothetical protein